ncbi:MAG: TIGR02266 family protein, partial [Myxococcales bacterium]
MADARKDRRTLLSLKIRYKSATLEDFIERYSMDISRGGVFIKAKKPLAVGTLLKFEFMLQDQSTLIHGVGRVVWRRDEAEADAQNPSGMGIKFIKMDPESRAVVQRIAEDRGHPGVFEHGKEGVQLAPAMPSDPGDLGEADRTKVRHVSEFLASALEEGGAGDAAKREAQAGAERARQISNEIGGSRVAAARGAFRAHQGAHAETRQSASDAPSRGAMSAFGGSGLSASARISSAAAPAMEEFDAADDFLDDETTKIHDPSESDYPADVDATVIAKEAASAFVAEKRQTPVVPAASTSSLESGVPDLFGPAAAQSFGPAPGEFIDASLLDPAVPTVPPGAPVPDAPGIPAEAFKVPRAAEPVWTTRPTPKKKASRGWIVLLLFVLSLGGGAVVAWQLGFATELMDLAAPYLGETEKTVEAPRVAQPVAVPAAQPEPEETTVEAQPAEELVAADETEASEQAEAAAGAGPVAARDAGIVKFQVVSRPTGAFVSVNGKGAGRTPLELEYEVVTKLSLFSKARGYLARRQRITVEADQAPVKLVLLPLPYVVQVVTNPAGARASAVGGGEVTTPGELKFRSMPASRSIVVSKDGYKTASKSVMRGDFVEETRRMSATINVTLQKDGAAAP